MDALAPQVQYSVGPDGKMQATPVPNSPGSFAKKVIAGALEGFSKAASVQPGPGYTARAAAAGAGGGLQYAQQTDERGRAQATQDYNRQQQQIAQRAERVMTAQNYMTRQLQYIHGKFQYAQDVKNANNATEEQIDSQKMQRLGTLKNFQEVMDLAQSNPEVHKAWAEHRIFQSAHFDENGNQDGITVAIRQPGRRVLQKDLPIQYLTGETDKQTGMPLSTTRNIPAGTDEEEAYANMNAAADTKLKALDAWNKTNLEKQERARQERVANAQIRASNAEANLRDKQASYLGNPATEGPDSLGFTPAAGMPAKEYLKREDAWKKNTDHLIATEQRYREFQDGINAIQQGDWTGARSVAALFNAIGLSTVNDKGGMRVTKNIISEHEHARGWVGELQNRLESIKNGQVITPKQLQDYASVAAEMRANEYIATANQAHNDGLRADFILPNGNGQKLDPSSAKIFYTLANGNPTQAFAAAKEHGWDTSPVQGK
jgi:hypothetical protein